MPNPYFRFKQFTVYHDRCAMKITTDACLFGAWCATEIQNETIKISRLLEIGTGTGLLSVMIAQKNDLSIDAVEIDAEASEQARENAGSSPWQNRIHIIHEDIRNFQSTQGYDVIVSNPPFYENEISSQQASKNLAHHSSELKLSELFWMIKNNLAGTGFFFLLLPYKRQKELEKLLEQHRLFVYKKVVVHQSTAHDPFRIMLMGGQNVAATHQSTIAIREGKEYTQDFIQLLRDYYLYL